MYLENLYGNNEEALIENPYINKDDMIVEPLCWINACIANAGCIINLWG